MNKMKALRIQTGTQCPFVAVS
eukprot:SAG25_NODE_11748_length_296_cov_1.040609_1_plen_21_part_10